MNNIPQLLSPLRESIDAIDAEIQSLIVKRADLVKEVSRIKQQEENAVFYRPEREAAILNKIMDRDCGALPPKEVAKIFREIMSACLALQKPVRIAYLGPEGTFSQAAALKHFGSSLHQVPCDTIPMIFSKVEAGEANYGVIPIENSIGGLVETSLHEFIDSPLNICGEVTLEIKQCLLKQRESVSEIKKIYSHQQSLLQCQNWLGKHHPQAELIAVASNALAARHASAEADTAAIAGEQCADLYDLEIISDNIGDQIHNQTRFLIVGSYRPEKSGADRTTLLITAHDAPGALEKLINPLAKNHINITMIRSKPAPGNLNTCYFFLDLDCFADDVAFIRARQEMQQGPMTIKILGSYPRAVL